MHREPSSDGERVLRDACSFVLQVPTAEVNLDRSFIANGGDSISAMRVSPYCKSNGRTVSVATILASKSLADAAAASSLCGSNMAPSAAAQAGATKEDADAIKMGTALEPFCLLRLEKKDVEDLLDKIAPDLRFPTSQVLDMAPTTHTQALCAGAAMRGPPQGCYVFYIDIPQVVQLDTITDFAQNLWNQVDILRTVFIRHAGPGDLLQVVAAPCPVNLDTHAVKEADSFQDESERLFEESIQSPLELGALYVKFMVLHGSKSPTRLAFRLSHAHYDGMSLPPILDCLAASLQGQPWPVIPKFIGYLAHVLDRNEKTLQQWKRTLVGSKPLTLQPTGDKCQILTATRIIEPPPKSASITEANMFLAVCAETLARLHDTRDVNFTLTVSGRTTIPDSLANVVGPCLNQVPFRVVLPPEASLNQTVELVRQAHLDMLPAEVATVQDIYKTCTDWPEEQQRMSYNVQFNDLVSRSVDLLGDGRQTPLLVHGPRGVWEHSEEIWIIATPGDGNWQILLSGNASRCCAEYLERIADVMAGVVAAGSV